MLHDPDTGEIIDEPDTNAGAVRALGIDRKGPAFAIDPLDIMAEMERRGIETAEAQYRYDVISDALPILLAKLTIEYRDLHRVKSLAEAETRAKAMVEYQDLVKQKAEAKRLAAIARIREKSFEAKYHATRTLIASEREAMRMR